MKKYIVPNTDELWYLTQSVLIGESPTVDYEENEGDPLSPIFGG